MTDFLVGVLMEIMSHVPPNVEIEEIIHQVNHLALICDGNRRWATAQGMHSTEGHTYSFTVLAPQLLAEIFDLGIHTVTFWCASTRNWSRIEEVSNAQQSVNIFVNKMIDLAHKKNIRLIHLGRKDCIADYLRASIEEAECLTALYDDHILNMAIDYGGRDEIVRACKKILALGITPDQLTEELLGQNMDTKNQQYPEPDLIIRPAGEQKLSGFMAWQNWYSEYFFVPQTFPEFDINVIKTALRELTSRRRTFSR